MDWKEKFKKSLDFTYEIVKRKVADIKYPCYSGEIYKYAFLIHQQELYFYLTPRGILFTPSGASVKEIPFSDIRKLAIKKGRIINWYHIRFIADKKYHFYIHCKKVFSTELTGDASENLKAFIETLRSSVKNN